MGLIKVVGKTLEYTGKLTQAEGFEEWAMGAGKGAIESLASKYGFKILGKMRAAKKEIFKELQLAGKSSTLTASITKVTNRYVEWMEDLSNNYSPLTEGHFPNQITALPCFYLDDAALVAVRTYLSNSAELARLKGGIELREYFFEELVKELRLNVPPINPSVKKPIKVSDTIDLIGIDLEYPWRDGKVTGHYYLCNKRKGTNNDRNKTEKNLSKPSAKLGSWSTQDKQNALKKFADYNGIKELSV